MSNSDKKAKTIHRKQITYWWNVSDELSKHFNTDILEGILDEHAQERINEMLSDGYLEGELLACIGDEDIMVTGYWSIKKDDNQEETMTAFFTKVVDELLEFSDWRCQKSRPLSTVNRTEVVCKILREWNEHNAN